ncbi:VOC family protein [Hymenobacter sp. BT491]|uniref:VOC family protein n=1 Tax=Hymenobacter sp. BT491 TaxID=2766779 RepID=UPI0016539941|nr:VOC family protein [Hymenobacter sp. BT491]MBC6991094.1 hypothetical protein [Hymenobacter sp. BT491]
MKNNFLVATLLLAGAALVLGRRKRKRHHYHGFGGQDKPVASQDTVVYFIADPSKLDKAVEWYEDFFLTKAEDKPVLGPGEKPYRSFKIETTNGSKSFIAVLLSTDPVYLQLNEPVFYWVLPDVKDVDIKYKKLKDKGSEFDKKPHSIKKPKGILGVREVTQKPTEVQAFIVVDPYGNRAGVVNNPIYVPSLITEE